MDTILRRFLLLLAATLAIPSATFAQPAPADPEPAPANAAAPADAKPADAEPEEESDSLLALVLKSGVTGWIFLAVLAIFSMIAATVAIERFVSVRRSVIAPTEFATELRTLAGRDDTTPERLHTLANGTDAPSAAILEAGLHRVGRPPMEVEKAMEDAAVREMADIRSRIRPLSVIGNVSPLVGLLGTVLGMIVSFRTASEAGLGKGGEVMAQGIYLALLTTAAGLSIAIPAMILAAHFHAKTERLFREIDVQLMPLVPLFARFEVETNRASALAQARADATHLEPEHPGNNGDPAETRPLVTAK